MVRLLAKCSCGPSRDGALGVIGISGKASLNDSDLYNLRMSTKWFDIQLSRSNIKGDSYEKRSYLDSTKLSYGFISGFGIVC